QVTVRQRYALGPAGRAAGVQKQRDVARFRRTVVDYHRAAVTELLDIDLAMAVQAALPEGQIEFAGCLTGRVLTRWHDDSLDAGVLHVEAKFLRLVSGVQGSGNGPCPRHAKKHYQKLEV